MELSRPVQVQELGFEPQLRWSGTAVTVAQFAHPDVRDAAELTAARRVRDIAEALHNCHESCGVVHRFAAPSAQSRHVP